MASAVPGSWNRWLSLAAATWLESCVGVGSGFGIWSQTLKATLGYNQQQLATIATFKDLGGNVGIIAGLVADVAPPWVVLLLGAFINLGGYLYLWSALSGHVSSPSFWQVAIFVMVASNGANWLNTAGMVTMVKTFPGSSGFLLGYLKGFIGLSAAIFVQLYSATVAPNAVNFLLLAAIVPSAVAILVMPFVYLRPARTEASEPKSFFLLALGSASLAVYLFTCSFLRQAYDVNKLVSREMVAGMLVLLSMPFLVASNEHQKLKAQAIAGGSGASSTGQVAEGSEVLLPSGGLSRSGGRQDEEAGRQGGTTETPLQGVDSEDGPRSPLLDISHRVRNVHSEEPTGTGQLAAVAGLGAAIEPVVDGTVVSKSSSSSDPPRRGEEQSLLQALGTLDYWLMFSALVLGCGSALAVSDNLGQIALVLDHEPGILVSLFSIAAFAGLLAGGYLSEHMLRTNGWPRPIFGGLTFAVLVLGLLVLASGCTGCVHVGAMTVGFSYGSIWAIMPAALSDLFGFKAYASLYNWLIIANPCGSYLLSVWVTGRLYDIEVEKDRLHPVLLLREERPGVYGEEASVACHGAHCFRTALLVLALASAIASVICFVLGAVTRRCYVEKFKRRAKGAGST